MLLEKLPSTHRSTWAQLKAEKFRAAIIGKVREISGNSEAQFKKIAEVVETKRG